MRTGEIIVSSVSGLNNKIYQIGDKVNERNFPLGNFEILIRDEFVKETFNVPEQKNAPEQKVVTKKK